MATQPLLYPETPKGRKMKWLFECHGARPAQGEVTSYTLQTGHHKIMRSITLPAERRILGCHQQDHPLTHSFLSVPSSDMALIFWQH